MIRYKKINGTETIEEICEHCGEVSRTLHVSDIITKSKHDNRTLTVKDRDGRDKAVESKEDYISNREADWIRKGLLSGSGETPKYGSRPESMCSESIDTVAGTTSSFCYRVTNDKFLAKYSSSYYDSSELDANVTGSKVGIDRNGNIIRMRSIKKIDMATGIPEADSRLKYKGPDDNSWWRSMNENDRKDQIGKAQGCAWMKSEYGEQAVKDMTVVSNFRDKLEWDAYMNRYCR